MWCFRKYFDVQKRMYQEIVENYIKRSLMTCTPPQVLLGGSKQQNSNGRGMWYTWDRGETPAVF
jgi:hypothetical protein